MKLSSNNILALALVLAGIGAQIAALPTWQTALTPAWIGGTLVVLAGVLRGIYSDNPKGGA